MLYDGMPPYLPTQDESPFTTTLPTHMFNFDEEIMEAMNMLNYPWDDCHHRSYFLPQSFNPLLPFANQCTIGTNDFIPPKNIV